MTLLYIISVSAAGAIDTTTVEPIFRDVIFILIMITGVGMALTLDNNRPDVKRKITLAYFFFSVFSSVFFSLLVITAYLEFNFAKFWFYLLVGFTAALSPQFARKVLPEAPEELKKGAFNLLRAFFSGMARKLEGNNTNIKDEENDTL